MDPKNLWDIYNLFDLVENNHNEFVNEYDYREYTNHMNENNDDPLNNDFFI